MDVDRIYEKLEKIEHELNQLITEVRVNAAEGRNVYVTRKEYENDKQQILVNRRWSFTTAIAVLAVAVEAVFDII